MACHIVRFRSRSHNKHKRFFFCIPTTFDYLKLKESSLNEFVKVKMHHQSYELRNNQHDTSGSQLTGVTYVR